MMSQSNPLSPLESMKRAAKRAADKGSRSERAEKLSDAFEMFSKETVRLEAAYASISKQFASVNRELEETNCKLKDKILELDQTTHYLDSILTNMTQGLLLVTLDGIVSTYTPNAYRILEVAGTQVIEQSYWDSFPDELFGFSMRQALETRQAPKLSYVKIAPTVNYEEERELEIQTSFMLKNPLAPEHHQTIEGIIVLIRDISEIKQLELNVQRSHRLKSLGEMVALVVHELRNPLGGIRGFAGLLTHDLKELPKARKLAEQIVKASDDLNAILGNILNYTRPLQLKREEIELNSLVKEVLDYVRLDSKIEEKADLRLHGTDRPLTVFADPRLIKSMLLNLILNSADAIEEKGEIAVGLGESKRWTSLEVKDSGAGIPEQRLDDIFKPFFTTKPHGNGFGLAEVEKIVLAHEGKIEVRSSPGRGACFLIKLPRKYGY